MLNLGGTILGTSREKPFKKRLSAASEDKPALMLKNIHELGLDCIVCIGGNGTQKTAAKLAQAGVNVVSVPKTIDNDVWGTDVSFGFDSAVTIATDAIDRLHSTASSHQRVMVIEVMDIKPDGLPFTQAWQAAVMLFSSRNYPIISTTSATPLSKD